MQKNVASQKLIVFAFDATTNLPKSGDSANITAYVSIDYGAVTVLGDTSATEMDATNAKGYYLFDLTQGETNGNTLLFSAKSSTANIVVVGAPASIQTVPSSFVVAPGSANALTVAGSNAATTFSGLTTGAIAATTITASGAVAFQSTFAVTTSTALAALSATTVTISSAVALQSTVAVTGTITYTGNVAYSNGIFVAGGTQLHALSLSAAATGDGLHTVGNTTGNGINAIAGGTGVDIKGAITGNITGNLSGSIGSLAAQAKTDVTAAALTTQMTESYRANGVAPTMAQAQFEVLAHLGESAIVATVKTINKIDHATPAETFTLDSATAPTSISRAT